MTGSASPDDSTPCGPLAPWGFLSLTACHSNAPLIWDHLGSTVLRSWSDLEFSIRRCAALLNNIEKGHRILVVAQKSIEVVVVYLTCLFRGLVFVPINPDYGVSYLKHFVTDCEPAVVCHDHSSLLTPELLEEWENQGVPPPRCIDLNKLHGLLDAHSEAPAREVDDDTLAVIIYTSGTTGTPKGAMLSHGNLKANATALQALWGIQQNDKLIHILPLFHIHGLLVVLNLALITQNASLVWDASFSVTRVLESLRGSTVLMAVPTIYARLLKAVPDEELREITASMRLFICGSAPLSKQVRDAWYQRTGQAILERYGMSETLIISSQSVDPKERWESRMTVGNILPNMEVRVLSDGAVQVRGASVCKGYFRAPQKTADSFTEDGWFKTGDQGHWQQSEVDGERKYLVLDGRASEVIIRGGFNVYPQELEKLVMDICGQILDACVVFGIPCEDMGQTVGLGLVLRPEVEPSLPIMTDLSAMLSRELPRYKRPQKILILREVPKNAMGKTMRGTLGTEYMKLALKRERTQSRGDKRTLEGEGEKHIMTI